MWKPKEDRVVLKAVPPEEKTKSGLIIPNEAQKISEWEVLAVGPNKQDIQLLPGMRVMVSDGAGMEITVDGQDQKVVRFSDIHLYDDQPQSS